MHTSSVAFLHHARLSLAAVFLLVLSTGCGMLGGDGLRVAIDRPADAATLDRSVVDVTGTIVVPGERGSLTVTVNGDQLAGCSIADERFTCPDVLLATGTNEIVAIARDGTGAEASDVAVVTVPPLDPELTISETTRTTSRTSNLSDVRGTVVDADGIARVHLTINGDSVGACLVRIAEYICPDVPLREGANDLVVTAVDATGRSTTESIVVSYAPSVDGFDITLVYYEHSFSDPQIAAFEEAADIWSSVVVNDLQGFTANFAADEACGQGEPALSDEVDDLLIFVTGFEQAEGGVLGQAGPCRTRTRGENEGTNAIGFMEFDIADLAWLEDRGRLVDTIAHEMGHVLGIGTNWEFDPFHVLAYETFDDDLCEVASGFHVGPVYTGLGGWAGYLAVGGTENAVPVEDEGGFGTQCGHWDDEVFRNELMSGFLNYDQENPMSELTVRSLSDIGFEVDVTEAEPYRVPALRSYRDANGFAIGERETLLKPIGGVDPVTGDLVPLPTPDGS